MPVMKVRVGRRSIRPSPRRSLGQGGEAEVFDIGGGTALKLFKLPDHPDFAGSAALQQATRDRLKEHQDKLPAFPQGLPDRVVGPQELARDRTGQLVGYSMRRVQSAESLNAWGDPASLRSPADAVAVLRDLHSSTLEALHRRSVVIGDFNDMNVLVVPGKAHIIDADSFQFDRFACRMYTERFLDPRICDPNAPRPQPVSPQDRDSDWYAFTVMLMRLLLGIDPYGGVHRPKSASQRVPHPARPLHRISIFHPEVRYPRAARPLDVLPDDLLQHLHSVLHQDLRGPFPAALLDRLRFTRCRDCGSEHGRPLCPRCNLPATVVARVRVRGQVTATRVHGARVGILTATAAGGRLAWLADQGGGRCSRDDGSEWNPTTPPHAVVRLAGPRTFVASRGTITTDALADAGIPVDEVDGIPAFDANHHHLYWVDQGRLWRDDPVGPVALGEVLSHQTRIWVGDRFGFGFYRAGGLWMPFVFDARARGIRDGLAVPRIPGQLLDAGCFFTDDAAWFHARYETAGQVELMACRIRPDGSVDLVARPDPSEPWTQSLSGACAIGPFVFVPTDQGVVRAEASGTGLAITREFPDTEPFVHEGCRLLPAADGLWVVSEKEILHLEMRP